jgi:hypothetical protein
VLVEVAKAHRLEELQGQHSKRLESARAQIRAQVQAPVMSLQALRRPPRAEAKALRWVLQGWSELWQPRERAGLQGSMLGGRDCFACVWLLEARRVMRMVDALWK